ncbi:MAG: aminopeptidase P N-terminal domain-containing protein, partial [Bacteroidales bacterium]|nr:aminopeptidase P N-terminal domain-containing protein [Candidatus Cryptobacteroides fimicaballi]
MFSTEVYKSRRAALLQRMKGESGIILFLGNVDSPAQYRDNCYKWRQDSNWLYFFGIDEPGFSAVIDLESGEETVYADDFDVDDIIWTGPMESVASQAARAGVRNSLPAAKLSWAVSEAIIKGRRIHFLPVSRYYNALRMASLTGLEPEETFSKGKA